ncbi:MAG: SDR family oxidoreductase [Elusimicrobia bacterium]|nr:SDR family oxidoreductase [Candidatus Liberimonas magnetica]
MKFLVTGGAGFIGSNIVGELVRRRYKVRVLDNFLTGKIENIKPFLNKIELVKGDIRNDKDLIKALKGIDYVLHQAALRSVPRSVDDPLSTNNVNITGTLKLLMTAREMKVKRVVYASSSSLYGDNKTPQVESMVPSPLSPYAVSKLAAEHYCSIYAKTFGLETVSLRYFNVFGPNQDPNSKYAAVIPIFIRCALNDREAEVHGDGKQSRDFSYIDNVVSANILAALTPGISGEYFNIACHASNSLLDIIRIIENLTKKKMKVKHTTPRKGDVRKTWADISKAKKLMKYKPLVSFEEGMVKTFNWIKEHN